MERVYLTYPDCDTAALAALLRRQRVGLTKSSTPVTSPNGQNAEFGDDDGGTDGCGHFLGGLDTEPDVALGIADDNNGLEARSLSGAGLLLHGLDLDIRRKG